MTANMHLAIVIGSTREGRFGSTVARWFVSQAEARPEFDLDVIDLSNPEWPAKPVAFVSYGGMSGGLRAVEQLRQVFGELHAVTIRDCVSFHNAWPLFDADGWLQEETGADLAAKTMLDRLAWWNRALHAGREAEPYAARCVGSR